MNIIIDKYMKLLSENEVSGREEYIYRFTNKSVLGKRNVTIGLSQHDFHARGSSDVGLNKLLESFGCTENEIKSIFDNTYSDKLLKKLNDKMETGDFNKIIDNLDKKYAHKTYLHCKKVLSKCFKYSVEDRVFIMIMDYHNQYYFSDGGKLFRHIRDSINNVLTEKFIVDYKLNTLFGKKRPDDVMRRYENMYRVGI